VLHPFSKYFKNIFSLNSFAKKNNPSKINKTQKGIRGKNSRQERNPRTEAASLGHLGTGFRANSELTETFVAMAHQHFCEQETCRIQLNWVNSRYRHSKAYGANSFVSQANPQKIGLQNLVYLFMTLSISVNIGYLSTHSE